MTTAEALTIDCESCGASLTVEAHLKTAQCPYCDSPSIVERPPTRDRPEPAFALGFVIQQDDAAERVKRWIKSRGLFVRSDFKKKASVERTRGVYLPAYLYGAEAQTSYNVEIGENYTETYTTVVNGKVQTRTRTKTEWRSLRGEYATWVQDILVTASKTIRNAELEAIEPYDLRALRSYDPAIVSGWIAEEPSISPENSEHLARREATDKVGVELNAFMPGDKHRDLRYSLNLDRETLDLVLLPVWVFAARYAPDEPPVRIVLNGQTGKVHGKAPLSKIKIGIAIALVLLLIAGIVIFVLVQNGTL